MTSLVTTPERRDDRSRRRAVIRGGCGVALVFALAGCARNAPAPETAPRPALQPTAPPVARVEAPAAPQGTLSATPPEHTAPSASAEDRVAENAPSPTRSPESSDVQLMVNLALVRKHPVLARVGPILTQEMNDLASAAVPLEPLRDIDWFSAYGPSLDRTDHDILMARPQASDDTIAKAIAALVRRYDKGGPYEIGVPGVKASLGYADHGQRVFLQPRPKLVAIAPPADAHDVAAASRLQAPNGPAATEALRLVLRQPARQVPSRFRTPALTEVRLWITPKASDGSAELEGEGECGSPEAAKELAAKLTQTIHGMNSLLVRSITRGLLNNAVVSTDGGRVSLHIHGTAEQLDAIIDVLASFRGVALPTPPSHP